MTLPRSFPGDQDPQQFNGLWPFFITFSLIQLIACTKIGIRYPSIPNLYFLFYQTIIASYIVFCIESGREHLTDNGSGIAFVSYGVLSGRDNM
jgi:hypothetical protein